ncbi:MAG: DMT family transporter [Burkholderiales bacterium]|nr:DMT family transporter [Burkholderiales bacterium]
MALAASTTLVGSYVGLSKLLVAALPVFLLAWLRFGIAAMAMLHWLRRAPGEAPLSPRDRRLLFWESFLGNFLFSICMLYGVKLSGVVAAGVVMAGIPAAVALGSWWLLRERVGLRIWAAVACAVAGVVLLALVRSPAAPGSGGAPAAPASPWGFVLLLGAVLCEASYVVIGKRLTAQVSPRRISALINLWGLALVTPFGLWQASRFDFGAVSTPTWALLVFYALAASMVTVWLWMAGLAHVPAAQSGVFMVMVPVSAALVGVLLLGEPFGAGHAAAFAFALLGVLLATWPARRPEGGAAREGVPSPTVM